MQRRLSHQESLPNTMPSSWYQHQCWAYNNTSKFLITLSKYYHCSPWITSFVFTRGKNSWIVFLVNPCAGIMLVLEFNLSQSVDNGVSRDESICREHLWKTKKSYISSLWTSGVIWCPVHQSTLAQVMAYCLTAPSHYLSQYWLIIGRILCHSSLTHWGRVTHICVIELTIIGSDNGLSPGRRQAIICSNAGILLIGPLGTNFSEILIEIHTFSFKKLHLKMSSGKCRPFCLGLNSAGQNSWM